MNFCSQFQLKNKLRLSSKFEWPIVQQKGLNLLNTFYIDYFSQMGGIKSPALRLESKSYLTIWLNKSTQSKWLL